MADQVSAFPTDVQVSPEVAGSGGLLCPLQPEVTRGGVPHKGPGQGPSCPRA